MNARHMTLRPSAMLLRRLAAATLAATFLIALSGPISPAMAGGGKDKKIAKINKKYDDKMNKIAARQMKGGLSAKQNQKLTDKYNKLEDKRFNKVKKVKNGDDD